MAKTSVFDPKVNNQTDNTIIVALERISEAFRVLMWEKSKLLGVSPLQLQILIFIYYHNQKLCTVAQIALELNLTKATISDAIKVLVQKKLLLRSVNTHDRRSFFLKTTPLGTTKITEAERYVQDFTEILASLPPNLKNTLHVALAQIIYKLKQLNIIAVQRMCFSCKQYAGNQNNKHFCNYHNKPLHSTDLQLDCCYFQSNNTNHH